MKGREKYFKPLPMPAISIAQLEFSGCCVLLCSHRAKQENKSPLPKGAVFKGSRAGDANTRPSRSCWTATPIMHASYGSSEWFTPPSRDQGANLIRKIIMKLESSKLV